MLKIKINSDIFIRGMSPGVRISKAGCRYRQSQNMHKGVIGSGTTAHRDEFHRHLKDFLRCLSDQLDKWIVGVGSGWSIATQIGNLDVRESLSIQVGAQVLQNIGRMLVRD